MQAAFNVILDEQGKPIIPFSAMPSEQDEFTTAELELYAKPLYQSYDITKEQSQLFFNHHIEPPEAYLPQELLPQMEIADATKVPSLSEAQIRWYHQICIAGGAQNLKKEQYEAFARRFYELAFSPPSGQFIFEFDLPITADGFLTIEQSLYYFFYCAARQHEKLSLPDQVSLHAVLQRFRLDSALPELQQEGVSKLPGSILEPYRKQYLAKQYLWEEKSEAFQLAFNDALRRENLAPIQGRAVGTYRDSLSMFLGVTLRLGLEHLSDQALMSVEYDPDALSHQAYLEIIPSERVNFLHPSMIKHLPSHKIVHIESPTLVHEIPNDKLYFVHPRVLPILTKSQEEALPELAVKVSELSQEDVRLLLCPLFTKALREDQMYDLSTQARLYLSQLPIRISPFQRAFF